MHRRLAVPLFALAACRDVPTPAVPQVEDGVGPVSAEGLAAGPSLATNRPSVVYLVMPDRFVDGDPLNNERGLPDCYDPDNPVKFHGGDLEGLRRHVGYLEELGVDALWSTPLYRQAYGKTDWCPFHGYWADFTVPDDGALEPRLGTQSALLRLIERLDAGGIGFIADMVVNHPGDHARIVDQRPAWFHDPQSCADEGDEVVDCPFRPGAFDFAQEDPEVAAYLTQVSRGWVQRFPISGIRMDTAKHVRPQYFREQWLPAIRGERDGLFLVAEVFSGDPGELRTYLDAGFDGALNYPLHGAFIRGFAKNEGLQHVSEGVDRLVRELGDRRVHGLVNFLDNHDVPRFVSEIPDDVARDEALSRYHLALAALFAVPGVPQVYYGDELAQYGGRDPDNRRDMPGWAFSKRGRSQSRPGEALGVPQETFALVQQLTALRRRSAALREGAYTSIREPGAQNIWIFARQVADERMVVILNGDDVDMPIPNSVLGRALRVEWGKAKLAAGEVQIGALGAAVLRTSPTD